MRKLRRLITFLLVAVVCVTNLPILAQAEEVQKVTITWNANGGTFSDGSSEKTSNPFANMVFSPYGENPVYVDETKVFGGWTTEQNGNQFYSMNDVATDGLTYYAYWMDAVSVTFDANGGSFVGNFSMTALVPKGYNKSGMSSYSAWTNFDALSSESNYVAPENTMFRGWALHADGSDIIENMLQYHFDENTTLYAVWAPKVTLTIDLGTTAHAMNTTTATSANYGITFYTPLTAGNSMLYQPNGTVSEDGRYVSFTVPSGYTFSLNSLSASAGFVTEDQNQAFLGWSEDAAGKMLYTESNSSNIQMNKDITLYAIWGLGVTVTLDANGGYFDGNATQKQIMVADNATLNYSIMLGYAPNYSDATKSFYGWSTTPDESGLVISSLQYEYKLGTEPVTLYAIYQEYNSDFYSVTYDANGKGYFLGSGTKKDTCQYSYSKNYSFPTTIENDANGYSIMNGSLGFVSNDGSALIGWSLDKNATTCDGETVVLDKDVTLYPILAKGYHLTLNPGDGAWKKNTNMYQMSASYLVDTIVPEGFRLASLNGFFGAGLYNTNMAEVFTVPTGTMFAGWTTVKNDPSTLITNETLETDTTLYAYYVKTAVITLDANGGYFNNSESSTQLTYTCEEGKPYTVGPNAAINGNKVFAGWSKTKDGSEMVGSTYGFGGNTFTVASATTETYYAIYKDAYTITFYPNGGTFADNSNRLTYEVKVGAGDTISNPPTVTKSGKYLVGWTDVKPGEKVTSDSIVLSLYGYQTDEYFYSYVPKKNLKLYAVWADTVDITLEAGEYGCFWQYDVATGMINEVQSMIVTVPKGQNFYISTMPTQKAGYENYFFEGYAKEPNGEVVIKNNDIYVFDEPGTYYAIFRDPATVTPEPEVTPTTPSENNASGNTTAPTENVTPSNENVAPSAEVAFREEQTTTVISQQEKAVVPNTEKQAEVKSAKMVNSLRAQMEDTVFTPEEVESPSGSSVLIDSIEAVRDENALNSLQQVVTSVMKSTMETETTVQEVKLVELNARGSGQVRFLVGKEYAGFYTVVGHYHDGVWTTQQCLVDRNGYITPNFVSFSPIAIMVTTSKEELTALETAAEPTLLDDSHVVITTGPAAVTAANTATTAATAEGKTSPKTGEGIDARLVITILAIMFLALELGLDRKSRKEN